MGGLHRDQVVCCQVVIILLQTEMGPGLAGLGFGLYFTCVCVGPAWRANSRNSQVDKLRKNRRRPTQEWMRAQACDADVRCQPQLSVQLNNHLLDPHTVDGDVAGCSTLNYCCALQAVPTTKHRQ